MTPSTDQHIVLFEYQPNRAGAHPKQFLQDFSGYLHTDGYAGYHTLPDEKYNQRLEKSKPLAEAFFKWLKTLHHLPKSLMGRAIGYALDQKVWLMNFYLDGRSELSNNRDERIHISLTRWLLLICIEHPFLPFHLF